jgi:hypothetical protein
MNEEKRSKEKRKNGTERKEEMRVRKMKGKD